MGKGFPQRNPNRESEERHRDEFEVINKQGEKLFEIVNKILVDYETTIPRKKWELMFRPKNVRHAFKVDEEGKPRFIWKSRSFRVLLLIETSGRTILLVRSRSFDKQIVFQKLMDKLNEDTGLEIDCYY